MLERYMDPPSNNDQYLMLTQKEEENEGDDGVISCWSGDDGDWFLNEAGWDFSNKSELLHDMIEAQSTWGFQRIKTGPPR